MPKAEIFTLIARHAGDVVPTLKDHEFQRSDRWLHLGTNSLDRADIIEATMESLSLRIPRVEVFGTRNIGELVDVLHEKLTSNH